MSEVPWLMDCWYRATVLYDCDRLAARDLARLLSCGACRGRLWDERGVYDLHFRDEGDLAEVEGVVSRIRDRCGRGSISLDIDFDVPDDCVEVDRCRTSPTASGRPAGPDPATRSSTSWRRCGPST